MQQRVGTNDDPSIAEVASQFLDLLGPLSDHIGADLHHGFVGILHLLVLDEVDGLVVTIDDDR